MWIIRLTLDENLYYTVNFECFTFDELRFDDVFYSIGNLIQASAFYHESGEEVSLYELNLNDKRLVLGKEIFKPVIV